MRDDVTSSSAVHDVDFDAPLLRQVLNATRLLVLVVDERGNVVVANRRFEQAAGLAPDAWRRPIWELPVQRHERTLLRAAFDPLRPEALPSGLLFHLTTATAPRTIDWDVRVLRDDGAPALVVLTGIDLSDRLSAEQHLHDSEALQRLVLDRLPAIIWATDTELRFMYNGGGGVLSSLDIAPGQVALTGTSLYSYFHTTDPEHAAIARHLAALRGEASSYEMRWRDRLFQTRVEPLRDRNDRIVGTVGIALDVTEQAQTAEALRKSEAHLRRLVESNVIGILFWDESGAVTEANEAFLELLGFSRDEMRARLMSWRAQTPPEHHLLDERAIEQLRATGRFAPFEKEFIARDGTRVPVLVGGATFDEPSAAGLAGVAFILDLREQVQLRRARDQLLVKEQRARLETEVANARLKLLVEGSKRLSRAMSATETLETLAAVVVPCLADWSYVVHRGWDGAALATGTHGDPSKRALMQRLQSCTPDPAAPEGAAKVMRTGELALYHDITAEQLAPTPPAWPILATRDPEHLHAIRELGMRSLLCVPIAGRAGVDGVLVLVSATDPQRYGHDDVVLAQDLAARAAVSLENGRLLSEALESVQARDEFLAVAAHELRTPLTSLLLQIQLLARAFDRERLDVDAARANARAAESNARRLAVLVDRLLDVSRLAQNRVSIRTEEVDLAALVREVVDALAGAGKAVGCEMRVTAPERVTGRWDRARIEQVLGNVLANAIKFGAGKPIEVDVSATATDVRIAVRDHGIGISRADQGRIFGRFERAVSARHFGGLGLGLYISAHILRAHHGALRVESEPGQGACFIIELPRGADETVAAAAVPS